MLMPEPWLTTICLSAACGGVHQELVVHPASHGQRPRHHRPHRARRQAQRLLAVDGAHLRRQHDRRLQGDPLAVKQRHPNSKSAVHHG